MPKASRTESKRVLFVCTGNTCRSPMAAALAAALAREAGLDWTFSSAGTAAVDGAPLSAGAESLLAARGIGPVRHASRKLTASIAMAADEIIALTRAHRTEIVARFPDCADKTLVLRQAAGLEPSDIEDPAGAQTAVYQACAASIEEALSILMRRRTHAQDTR